MNESELDEQIMNNLSLGLGHFGYGSNAYSVLELRWKGQRIDYLDCHDLKKILGGSHEA